MGGAYVLKPALVISYTPVEGVNIEAGVDYPDGWNLDWPYPGPNPPGYDSEGVIVAYSQPSIDPTDSVASYGRLESSGGGPAGLPPGDWTQTWSASKDGYVVGIRTYGAGAFASSIQYVFDDFASSYYLVYDDIEFDLDEGDRGGTVTLSIDSELGEDTYDISIKKINTNKLYVSLSAYIHPWNSGTAVFSCGGSTITMDAASNAITGVTGVFTQAGSRTATVDAEGTALLDGQTGTLDFSSCNTKSLPVSTSWNRVVASVVLLHRIGYTLDAVSGSVGFDLAGNECGSDSAAIVAIGVDELTDLT